MKTKAGLVILSLLGAANMAMAQEGMQQEAPGATEPAAASAPVPEQAAKRKAVRRQGADMRHCLDLKDRRAIIRCAEPGRKP